MMIEKDVVKNYLLRKKMNILMVTVLIVGALLSYQLLINNDKYYHQTIAKITAVTNSENTQQLKAIILNGIHKNETIELTNNITQSEALEVTYKVNDKVFISLSVDNAKNIINANITGFKRDNYLAYIIICFTVLILAIGGLKGARSLLSVAVNIILFYIFIQLYLSGYNLFLITAVISLLFIVSSLYIVNGRNKKTVSAILGTLVGTIISLTIALLVFYLSGSSGIHYEVMEFITRKPQQIFFVEILMGTLGGIMDIAITMSSAVKEIVDNNPTIEKEKIITSGMEIGKDIMGTMSNTVVFAYISGSIPLILLWIKNGIPITSILNLSISLEIVRALTSTIGIILSIPITLEIAVWLLRRKEARV